MTPYPDTPPQPYDWPPGAIITLPDGQGRLTVPVTAAPGFDSPFLPIIPTTPNTLIPITPAFSLPGNVAQGFVSYFTYIEVGIYWWEPLTNPINVPASLYDARWRLGDYGGSQYSVGPSAVYYDGFFESNGWHQDIIVYSGGSSHALENTAWTCTHEDIMTIWDGNGDGQPDVMHYYHGISYQWQRHHFCWLYHAYIPIGRAPVLTPLLLACALLALPFLASVAPASASASANNGGSAGRRKKS